MATLLDGADQDQQDGGVAPGLLNEGAPRTPETNRGPLSVLFPSGPYSAIPGLNLGALRRSQLLDLGARLLATGGPKPQGTSSALSDVGGALGGAMESWQNRLPQAANSAMQLIQFQYQMQGRQALTQAMRAAGPQPDASASPGAMGRWATDVAAELSKTGSPAAMPFIQQFAAMAETFHRASGDLQHEDGVLTPDMVRGNPRLQQYVGLYGSIGSDPQSADVISFVPKPRLTPEQALSKGMEWRRQYMEEQTDARNAAGAFQAYLTIPKSAIDKGSGTQLAQIYGRMLGTNGLPPGMSPVQGKTFSDLFTEMLTNAGTLDTASRARYNAAIEALAQRWKKFSKQTYEHFTHGAPDEISTTDYVDPWADFLNEKSAAPQPTGRAQRRLTAAEAQRAQQEGPP